MVLFGEVEADEDREALRLSNRTKALYLIVTPLVLLALVAWSVTISSTDITVSQVYGSLINALFPGTFDIPDTVQQIVMKVYAPRVLMAVFVGGILAIGGCITQTILKNLLATPYTLGVSSSAAFGAGMAMILGISASVGITGVMLNAFLFSLVPAGIILLATARRSIGSTTMILIGVSLSYLFSAANTLMQYFGESDAVKRALFWAVGDLNDAMLSQVPYVAVTMVFTLILAMFLMKDMDVMRMGDDTATALGINVRFIRTAAVILACLSTAVAVSFVGAIGFVCLLAPQISRIFVGNGLRYLIPASMFTGALLLVAADIVAKSVIAPIMLPVGAITAVVGAPILIYLLVRRRNPMML